MNAAYDGRDRVVMVTGTGPSLVAGPAADPVAAADAGAIGLSFQCGDLRRMLAISASRCSSQMLP
ncbi:MAG TPA: hypothetical protein VLW50_00340 [Streptosporangiaceae bacterium]|nr:hypothetical protein [Streptosporangiaceae bacterium]